MRTHALLAVVGVSGLLGGFWVTACSVDTNGAAPEPEDASDGSTTDASVADTSTDATVGDGAQPDSGSKDGSALDGHLETSTDAAACNATNCGGACCGDVCVARTCEGCNVGTLFCGYNGGAIQNSNGFCVASCSACTSGDGGADGGPTAELACVTCNGAATTASCVTSLDQCPATTSAGACGCAANDAGEAGACPNGTQVCVAPDAGAACLTCGQPGTDGQPCGNGTTCNESAALCAP